MQTSVTPPIRGRFFGQPIFRFGVLLAAAGLAFCPLAHAGSKKIKPTPPYQAPYDKIDAVDTKAKTITVSHVNSTNHGVKTFVVNELTEIQVDGTDMTKGDMSGLRAGMHVNASSGSTEGVADRIVATAK